VEWGLVEQQNQHYNAVAIQENGYRMLELLAFNAQDILQRYAVVLNLLQQHGPLKREELEQQSQDLAKRLNTLHGANSPEYLDKNLFATLVNALKQTEACLVDDNNRLLAAENLLPLRQTVNSLLHADVLQTVLHIVQRPA